MHIKSLTVILLLLILVFSVSLVADDLLYTSTLENTAAQKRVKVKASFTSVAGQSGKIVVTNGVNNWPRVKSLIVKLNGKKIITKTQVNSKVGVFKLNVTLKEKNNIVIISRKKGAGKVKVSFFGTKGGGGGQQPVLNNIVGYGDSLLAGFIDGTLLEDNQVWNFGSQIAKSAKKDFVLPLIDDPGNPARLVYIDGAGKLKPLDAVAPGGRVDLDAKLDNFSVPGTTAWASRNVKTLGGDSTKDPFKIVLGGNKTLLQSVIDSNPSLVLFWIGSNDVLGMVTSQDVNDHTKLSDFVKDYKYILRQLKRTNAKIIAANIPDITTVAYLVDPKDAPIAPTIIRFLIKAPDNVRIPATLLLDIILKGSSNSVTLTPDQYLTQAQLNAIREIVKDFNKEIAKACDAQGIPLIDIYSTSIDWYNNGINVAGNHLTTKYLEGIFSLDGLHPTITTHALIANMFIDRTNKEFGTDIKKVSVDEAYMNDPNQTYTGLTPPSRISGASFKINFKEMNELFQRIRAAESKAKSKRK